MINRGYVTHYTILRNTYVRDHHRREIVIIVITIKDIPTEHSLDMEAGVTYL